MELKIRLAKARLCAQPLRAFHAVREHRGGAFAKAVPSLMEAKEASARNRRTGGRASAMVQLWWASRLRPMATGDHNVKVVGSFGTQTDTEVQGAPVDATHRWLRKRVLTEDVEMVDEAASTLLSKTGVSNRKRSAAARKCLIKALSKHLSSEGQWSREAISMVQNALLLLLAQFVRTTRTARSRHYFYQALQSDHDLPSDDCFARNFER